MLMVAKQWLARLRFAQPAWLLSGAIALSLMGCESLTQVLPNLPLPTSFPIQSPNASPTSPGGPSAATQSDAAQSDAIAEMETIVQQNINKIRQEQGLKPLKNNARLAQVARDYSRLMAE